MVRGLGVGLCAQLLAPPPQLHRSVVRGWAGLGVPSPFLCVSESWCPLGLGFSPCCRACLTDSPLPTPYPTSWKTGPWTPCSASCGGGSQSRSVYCVWSDGAGVQEAVEEAQCAGLPGKPPTTQACGLQRCAAWSEEPWGEVRRAPAGVGGNQKLGLGPGAGLGGVFSAVETYPGR